MRRPRQTLAAMLQSTIRPLAAVPAAAGFGVRRAQNQCAGPSALT